MSCLTSPPIYKLVSGLAERNREREIYIYIYIHMCIYIYTFTKERNGEKGRYGVVFPLLILPFSATSPKDQSAFIGLCADDSPARIHMHRQVQIYPASCLPPHICVPPCALVLVVTSPHSLSWIRQDSSKASSQVKQRWKTECLWEREDAG